MSKPRFTTIGLLVAIVVVGLGWLIERQRRREAERRLTLTQVSVDSQQRLASQREMELRESKAQLKSSQQELNAVLAALLGQTEYLAFPDRAPPIRERLLELKKDLQARPLMTEEELKRILVAPSPPPPDPK